MWELGSQYLLGPDLLVAPVTRAGATHWPVYLPAGDWYDFWTDERHAGRAGVSRADAAGVAPALRAGRRIIPLRAGPCSAPTSAPWTT